MEFEVINTVWGADDEEFGGGVHEIARPTAAFRRLLAGGEAAGAIRILDPSDSERGKLDRHVQSQEDGEAAYAKAQRDGVWHDGNREQFALDVAGGVRSDDLEES